MTGDEVRRRGKANKGPSSTPKVAAGNSGSVKKNDESATNSAPADEAQALPGARFGPMPGLSKHRLWSRTALILGLMTVVYFTSGRKEEIFADSKHLRGKSMETKCSPEITKSTCQVSKCGRLVTDALLSGEEVYSVIDLARRGFVSHPGVSVMDLGARLVKFDNIAKPLDGVFRKGDSLVFQAVKSKLQRMVSAHFGIDYWKLHLAGPVFLSMMKPGGKDVSRIVSHQETLSFTFSTVVFLNDHEKDFRGGRFVFVDSDNTNRTVIPTQGRALTFTSGLENRFFIEKLEAGISYFLTVGFTCDAGIKDPTF